MLKGNVLITGGSGFLGRAIIRRAEREGWPCSFTIYSRDETKQWELKHRYPEVRCVLGDVSRDLDRLMAVMQGHDTVVHAAAVKYIDTAEFNIWETIRVNIDGSRNVAIAAKAADVKRVVGISTDKACAPANTYGLTKALMEKIFSEANTNTDTRFVTVRYGNVVGSTGSVIPVFQRQLKETGGFRITDSKMTRFWLGVDQAIDLILWALESSEDFPGHTFISPCPGMRIVDLAEAVWFRNGMIGDPPITFTGIRPGEKLDEFLFNQQESPHVHIHEQGFVMAPATQTPHPPEKYSYSSEQAYHMLSVEEMVELIKDSELV